jgi:signal transduction histidine kinase
MLDHPVTQKFLASIAAISFAGVGGAAWTSAQRLERHDSQIKALEISQTSTIAELSVELKDIRKDVGEIKSGVAVLQERTAHYAEERERADGPARP